MTRPQDMGPADLAPNTVPPELVDRRQAVLSERNWFFNSLAPQAKERFLEALTTARDRGLDDEAAWMDAARAAELAYENEADARNPPPVDDARRD